MRRLNLHLQLPLHDCGYCSSSAPTTLDDIEFQAYIQDLAEAGYIRIEVQNNIEYYFATSKSQEFIKCAKPQDLLKSYIGVVTECAAKGITSAYLEKAMA